MAAPTSHVIGRLERPNAATKVLRLGAEFTVGGWAFCPELRSLPLKAGFAGASFVAGRADRVREDVALAHPDALAAGNSGFSLQLPAPETPGRRNLQVWVGPPGAETLLAEREIEVRSRVEPVAPLKRPALRRPSARRGSNPRLLLVGHNFNREGAPRSLLALGRSLSASGCVVRAVGPAPGPMVDAWRRAGIPVDFVGEPARSPTLEDAVSRCRRLAASYAAWAPDLVLANTLDCFWAVELAHFLGVPVVWSIRESVEPHFYFAERWPGDVAGWALDTVVRADALVFVAQATAELSRNLVDPNRVHLIPNGIDLAKVDRHRRAFGSRRRQKLRRSLGLTDSRPVLICVGTPCERKGQRVLLAALGDLRRRGQRPPCLFVGMRGGPYRDFLLGQAESLGVSDQAHWIDETSRVGEYLMSADLFVCPSYNESMPRVILEAMAYGVPVVASRVFGVPDMLAHGRCGQLVEAGNVEALADEIERFLRDPAPFADRARVAERRVRDSLTDNLTTAAYRDLIAGQLDRRGGGR